MPDMSVPNASRLDASSPGESAVARLGPGDALFREDMGDLLDSEYWERSRQPLHALAFLLPLMVLYEVGAAWQVASERGLPRNGADEWMRWALQSLGFGHTACLPLLVMAALIRGHMVRADRWHVSPYTLLGMMAESVLLAFCLVVMGQVQDLAFRELGCETVHDCVRTERLCNRGARDAGPPSEAVTDATRDGRSGAAGATATTADSVWRRAVTYIGAGVYEEVLFRFMLLPLLAWGFVRCRVPPRMSVVSSIVVTSVLFSAAHYLGPGGESFSVFTFTFRTMAGAYFGTVFVLRGVGVAAGTHALYDLLVGIVFLA